MVDPAILLASGSPRRRDLLALLVDIYESLSTDEDESFEPTQTPERIVVQLAVRKAVAGIAERPGLIVIGADTIVVSDGVVLNKPVDADEARAMLRRLSGRDHHVFTGVALVGPDVGIVRTAHRQSLVRFRTLDSSDIDRYIATRIWTDKAGAYGIQGAGGDVVESVTGCFLNVAGFPVCLVARLLQDQGCEVRKEPFECGFWSGSLCSEWP